MNQGVLYHYLQDDVEEARLVVVPTHEVNIILKTCHDSPTAGHYGVTHTLQKIRRAVTITGWDEIHGSLIC